MNANVSGKVEEEQESDEEESVESDEGIEAEIVENEGVGVGTITNRESPTTDTPNHSFRQQ